MRRANPSTSGSAPGFTGWTAPTTGRNRRVIGTTFIPDGHRYVTERLAVTSSLTDRGKPSIYPPLPFHWSRRTSRLMQTQSQIPAANKVEGLWVLLVQNDGELNTQDSDGRVPVMARAGNDQTYL